MSFLDDIAAFGLEKLDEDAVRSAFSAAETMAIDRLPTPEEVNLVQPVFERLSSAAPAFAGATRGAIGALLCSMSIGKVEQAQLDWLKTEATFEERRAASHAATDAVAARSLADQERWDMILSALKDIGSLLLTKALPFLLAAL